MVESSIITALRRYVAALESLDIHASHLVLFGSFARGDSDEFSDIDVIVISREFDESIDVSLIEKLWQATIPSDKRIEPIPCGEEEWRTDVCRPILEIARREGVVLPT